MVRVELAELALQDHKEQPESQEEQVILGRLVSLESERLEQPELPVFPARMESTVLTDK